MKKKTIAGVITLMALTGVFINYYGGELSFTSSERGIVSDSIGFNLASSERGIVPDSGGDES
jgi:hypothetical protein